MPTELYVVLFIIEQYQNSPCVPVTRTLLSENKSKVKQHAESTRSQEVPVAVPTLMVSTQFIYLELLPFPMPNIKAS